MNYYNMIFFLLKKTINILENAINSEKVKTEKLINELNCEKMKKEEFQKI